MLKGWMCTSNVSVQMCGSRLYLYAMIIQHGVDSRLVISISSYVGIIFNSPSEFEWYSCVALNTDAILRIFFGFQSFWILEACDENGYEPWKIIIKIHY